MLLSVYFIVKSFLSFYIRIRCKSSSSLLFVGVLDNLIDLLQHESDNPIEIKELCFSIISNLCQNCNKNKKLFRQKGGIDLIVNNLKDPAITTSARYALYTVAILDCLWNAILGNKKSETVFLDNEVLFCLTTHLYMFYMKM